MKPSSRIRSLFFEYPYRDKKQEDDVCHGIGERVSKRKPWRGDSVNGNVADIELLEIGEKIIQRVHEHKAEPGDFHLAGIIHERRHDVAKEENG